jgi:hypothetical protein
LLANIKKTILVNTGVIALTVALCASYTAGYYGYVYMDGPVGTLTYRMDSGVFRGLYTLEERGKALIYLEDEIQKVTNEQDFVLFMDQFPAAYMMTRAAHSAPSTWDILLYAYAYQNLFVEGFDSNDDFLLQEYFRVSGRTPDKIIYVLDKERLEHLSLWNSDYRFTRYVTQNFVQTYANDAELFSIIVFERN